MVTPENRDMTDHPAIAYGDKRDEGLLPFGNQLDELGLHWSTKGSKEYITDRCAVFGALGAYFNHAFGDSPLC